MKPTENGMKELSDITTNYSYAYLKELMLSGMSSWFNKDEKFTMDEICMPKVVMLNDQMQSSITSQLTDEGFYDPFSD